MSLKKHIPNLLTLGNLFCGTIATIFAVNGMFTETAIFVIGGIAFDFLDGFAARLLNVSGELGKQLDSLADMVTSGVVPGIVMFQLLSSGDYYLRTETLETMNWVGYRFDTIQLLGLLLTLGACYRLAKFNIDTRQSDSFIGVPTPAMSLFIISLPLVFEYSAYSFISDLVMNNYFLIAVTLVFTFLMNAEIPLFSLKFKNYNFKKNSIKYIFLLISIGLVIGVPILAIPLIIILYIFISLLSNLRKV